LIPVSVSENKSPEPSEPEPVTARCSLSENPVTPTSPSPVTVNNAAPPEARNVCAVCEPLTPANDQSVTADGL